MRLVHARIRMPTCTGPWHLAVENYGEDALMPAALAFGMRADCPAATKELTL